RQIDSDTTPVAVVARNMPSDMTSRQPSIVARRPNLSATPPMRIEPSAMPTSSADRTKPSVLRVIPHSLRISGDARSEEHTSELQSRENLVCRLLLEKKKQDEKQIRQR